MRKRIASRIATVALGLVAVAGVTIGSAAAETGPDGFPILNASASDNEIHTCEQVGSADQYGNRAVVCVDLLDGIVDWAGEPYTASSATVEVICQNSSGAEVQCANAEVGLGIYDPQGDSYYQTGTCGHAAGTCTGFASDPKRWAFHIQPVNVPVGIFTWNDTSGCSSSPTSTSDNWAVVDAAATIIELPQSDRNVSPSANFSSGHAYICF